MGRTLDNALLNLGLKGAFNESANKLGFNLEDLIGANHTTRHFISLIL